MSTHEHLIVTDTKGRLPDFRRRLHRLVSFGTKVLRKWEGPTWDHEQTSVVRLLTERGVIEKLAYVMANPVQAGLVRRAREWPGITVLPQELGRRTWTLRRPEVYFDAMAELRAFRRAYREALEQWRAGLREVVFPLGTWCMRQVHGVVVRN